MQCPLSFRCPLAPEVEVPARTSLPDGGLEHVGITLRVTCVTGWTDRFTRLLGDELSIVASEDVQITERFRAGDRRMILEEQGVLQLPRAGVEGPEDTMVVLVLDLMSAAWS